MLVIIQSCGGGRVLFTIQLFLLPTQRLNIDNRLYYTANFFFYFAFLMSHYQTQLGFVMDAVMEGNILFVTCKTRRCFTME